MGDDLRNLARVGGLLQAVSLDFRGFFPIFLDFSSVSRAWPKTVIEDCKTVYTSSILVVASNHFKWLGRAAKLIATGLPPAW
jgi:hypothetical protein